MSRVRRIAVVTGSRADYGLLYWLLQDLEAAADLELRLLVTGMHLSPEFGYTVREIEADGPPIAERVETLLSADSGVSVAKSVGLGVIGFADALERQRPDLLLLLGDRFEILAAAQAALFLRIPVAHAHGGEITEGAVDESIRHAISKLSSLHFVAAEPYRRRLIRMGEDPLRVHTVGALGLDQPQRRTLLDRGAWQAASGFQLGRQNFLVTFHPVTLGEARPLAEMEGLLRALERFPEARVVITLPNADAGGRALAARLHQWAAGQGTRVAVFDSLGSLRYLSLLALVDVVIGNSSSGLIEAPFFGTPTVNIGPRQAGRLRAASVLDCEADSDSIQQAIEQALSPRFRRGDRLVDSPYGSGDVAGAILKVLRETPLQGLERKPFHDPQ